MNIVVLFFYSLLTVNAQVTNSGSGGIPEVNGPSEIGHSGCLEKNVKYTIIKNPKNILVKDERQLKSDEKDFMHIFSSQWKICEGSKLPKFNHIIELSLFLDLKKLSKSEAKKGCNSNNEMESTQSVLNCMNKKELQMSFLKVKNNKEYVRFVAKKSIIHSGTKCWEDDLVYAEKAIEKISSILGLE